MSYTELEVEAEGKAYTVLYLPKKEVMAEGREDILMEQDLDKKRKITFI